MTKTDQVNRPEINDKDEYIAAKFVSYSAGHESDFVYSDRDFSIELLLTHLSALLEKISKLRTIEQHIRYLQNEGLSGEDTADLKRGLTELWRRGFLLSRNEIIEGMRKDTKSGKKGVPIERIAWISRDRPDSLLKSIESAAAMSKKFGREIRFIVIDSSSSSETIEKILKRLKGFSKEMNVQVQYAGNKERQKFSRELSQFAAKDGLTKEIVDFALRNTEGLEFTPGVNRNALLMATIGEAFIHADDDTIFQFSMQEYTQDELDISSVFDPTDARFYRDREQLLGKVSLGTMDVIAFHEKLLGKRIGNCLPESEEALHLEGISIDLARLLQRGGGQVRATMAGLCGDSGLRQPGMILYLTEEARERVMSSEIRYREEALLTREVYRKVKRLTVSGSSFFMTPHIGLDNRGILPPFFPMSRNSDGLFGVTLRSCLNEALIGYLPLAVFHDPPGKRQFTADELTQISYNVADLMILLILSFRYTHEIKEVNVRLQSLGDYLMRVGSLAENAFTEFVKARRLTEISQNIQHLHKLLDTYRGSPAYWREDVLNRIEALRRYAQSECIDIPSDIGPGRDPKEARALCRRLVRRYGELLYWWPVIFDAAKDLKDCGKGMLREL